MQRRNTSQFLINIFHNLMEYVSEIIHIPMKILRSRHCQLVLTNILREELEVAWCFHDVGMLGLSIYVHFS